MASASLFRRSYLPWLIELPLLLLAKSLYRVRVRGAKRLPTSGGVLLLANHLSFADAVVLQLACPRTIRFVGPEVLKPGGILETLYRMTKTIPLPSQISLGSIRGVVEALHRGEVVCLFPEGAISRTGQLMEIRRGFEVIARRAGVPVVPVSHDGLWGSVFSFSGNKYLFKSPRLMPTPVCVCFGDALQPEEATAARVRRELLDLGAQAFNERPVLKRHLGREVVRSLAKRPRHVEIVDRTVERREVSAGKLLAASAALSRRIRQQVSAKRVGIVLPPGAGAAIANIAVLCAGKVPVNLNFTSGRASLELSMKLGEIDTIISARAMQEKLPNFPWLPRTLDLKEEMAAVGKKSILLWLVAALVLPNQIVADLLGLPRRGNDEEAGLLFTSGSSGEPKGVALTHRNILANCWQISSLSILPQSANLLGCLPLFHCFGFTVTLWYPMLRGCRLITVPSPLDTRKMVDAISEDEVSVLVGAPTFLRPLLKRAEMREMRSVNLVVSGAEKLPFELHEAFLKQFYVEIMQGYGLTETTPVTNVNQPDPPIVTERGKFQPGKRLGSVGRMLPGISARILHPDTLEELPLTATGILAFKGANVFRGYLQDEKKTAAALRDGWFLTGDLARFDEAGFLYIEGRLSRFSKIGGEMIPHGTVEQKIADAFGWEQLEGPMLVVTGVPDPTKGEALVLLTTQEVTSDQIREKLLAAGLPNLWVPKLVFQVERIPQLGTGKLDLKGCSELASRAVAEAV